MPYRNLLAAIIAQACRDVVGGNSHTSVRLRRAAEAAAWLRGETCREYCEWLGLDYGKLQDWLKAPYWPDRRTTRYFDNYCKECKSQISSNFSLRLAPSLRRNLTQIQASETYPS